MLNSEKKRKEERRDEEKQKANEIDRDYANARK